MYYLCDHDSDNIFRESSCLVNCGPQHVNVHCRLFCTRLSKKLVFVPVAGAMTVVDSDRLVQPSNTQWPEVQPLVS